MIRRAVIKAGIRDSNGNLSIRTELQCRIKRESAGKRYCLIGGGNGTGKTNELVLEVAYLIRKSLQGKLPPLKVLFAHKSDSAAYKILIREKFLKFLPLGMVDENGKPFIDPATGKQQTLFRGQNKNDRQLFIGWPGTPEENCCVIEWSGLDSSSGCVQRLQDSGTDFDWIVASQVDSVGVFNNEEAFFALRTRLGRRTIPGFMQQLKMDANPCSGWPLTRFVMGQIDELEDPNDYYFTSSSTDENPHLSEQYRKERESLPPSQKARYFHGQWGTTDGSIYESFNPVTHVLPWRDIPVESTWSLYGFLDWGNNPHPFAALIIAVNHRGDAVIVKELEIYREVARRKADMCKAAYEDVIQRVAASINVGPDEIRKQWRGWYGPPDLNQIESTGKSKRQQLLTDLSPDMIPTASDAEIIERLRRENRWTGISVNIVPLKSKETNKSAHQAVLEAAQQLVYPLPGHASLKSGDDPGPRLYICADCPATIQQFTTATFDQKRPGCLDQTPVKNRFYQYAVNGKQDDIHHWDLHSAWMLAAVTVATARPPKPEQVYKPGIVSDKGRRRSTNAIYS